MIDYIEKEKEDGIILSVDYEKCFDCIERQSLISAMTSFNFGEVMMEWTHILYNGCTSKIINNGYLSEDVKLTRGYKQGAPCSPYYFLLCAELLAHSLRENKQIEGFAISDFSKLFGQYADDIDLYFKNRDSNFKQVCDTLSAFCENTGFKINYNKTTLYRVGTQNHAIANQYTKNMKVVSDQTNVLGVWVTTNKEKLCILNYEPVIVQCKALFKSWATRQVSLLGKITIINSLIASLFVYKMMVLPEMPTYMVSQLNKMGEEFIWNGRKAKIPLVKLQNSKRVGWARSCQLSNKRTFPQDQIGTNFGTG